jgi:voltage-dependent calcium channel
LLAAINNEGGAADDVNDALDERRAIKADFIRNHPSYDKVLWILSQKNPARRFCQMLVRPAGGERLNGRPPSPIVHTIFQLVLLIAVVGGIVVESVATPVYRRNYYAEHGRVRGSWFDIAESAFGLTLTVEFMIKIVADGFVFTPNAYVRSIWNILDFFIMAGLLINVTTGLIFIGGLSRFTRGLKALRALKLITLFEKTRLTFESLIISGILRILDAAMLAMLYMIPYAVWGLNIFAGLTNTCNDANVSGLSDCINEYENNVVTSATGDPAFAFPVPRVWAHPAPSTKFSFDSFRASLLILFEIVSLEGWIDVMGVVTSITSRNQQPQTNASLVNAIFFVVYNLLGGVVILTLFVR